ncbi:CHAT domain-containing protein [Trichocoleus sp. DQ-A3]|uniref:nSTAND1 domain-containing NTPase n=1 Tax=Cyanophyceae TaxID=3028117 RepID=UPI001687BD9A|nr:CHAT domain-containing protein [Coleofasciculus sp. FACHB-125]MBD1899894.1 CHAT domain-containing protein [Coleofasciculus sp. FACHB-125]
MNAFEFEITIQSKSGDNSWPIVLRCKQLDGLTTHSSGILQLSQDDFYKLTQQQENEKAYGIILGKALFIGNVRDTFVRALSMSSQDCLLRILLSIEAADNDEVRILHWERLCAPIDTDDSWQLLARDQRVPFSRYIPTPIDRRFPRIGRRDLRALVLVASPANIGKFQLAPFDVEAVVSGVKEALGTIPYEILANNVAGAIGPPTLQELSKQLTNAKKPYTLLHFVCHGKLIDRGETVLYWAQADNQVLPVTGTELLDELSNIGGRTGLPHFAFLCTCESADPRAEGALGGLAQRLVRDLGMPAVIAMTRKVSVETGLALGQSFYRRLRESGEIDTALQQATAGLGNRHDITVPALFSRLGGRPLFSDRSENGELTDEEIEDGIGKLRELLAERAPHASVLQQRFKTQAEKLSNTRGADSPVARDERHQALEELDNICDQVLDLSFDALAVGKQPPEYKAECPFPGLSSFGEKKYHKFFFGRDELIQELQKELEKDNFLAVIGPSGSGKSSVVLAGLIPKLKEQNPSLQWAYLTPGREPVKQLDRRLERLSKVSEQHSVLVVDQFEEVFTLCEDKDDRQEFITRLLTLASRRKVVMTMRADFLGECTFYPELSKRIETRQKLVGRMQPPELITAMKMQADKAGLRFEAGLSNSILDDVQEEPGAMPLLQHALQELWKRRHGRWLCDEEYQAIGRVQQAIAKTADDFYNSLPASEQEQVRNIFLRLTRMDASAVQGEKRRDTRRRVELEDLVSAGSDLAVTKKLVQQLAGEEARLVVTSRNEATDKEEVEVAHEALIRYWPRLQKWLDEDRTNLQLREIITQAAQEWKNHKENRNDYLIQGRRLEEAEALLKQPKFLSQLEAEYVKACVDLRQSRRNWRIVRWIAILLALLGVATVSIGIIIKSSLKQKKNVVFAYPGQTIDGRTQYVYQYPERGEGTINQILLGINNDKRAQACINAGSVVSKGDEFFKLTAPKEPGVYYVRFRYAQEFGCNERAKDWWTMGGVPDEKTNVGIIIVLGNPLNFAIYPQIFYSYSKNVPDLVSDGDLSSGKYIILGDFKLSGDDGKTGASQRFIAGCDYKQPVFHKHLSPNQRLEKGECVASENSFYYLKMQDDGNLVLIKSNGTPLWAAGTNPNGSYTVMQDDGNLVVYDLNNKPLWASHTNGSPDPQLSVQNDGNVVIYQNSRGKPQLIWETKTAGR